MEQSSEIGPLPAPCAERKVCIQRRENGGFDIVEYLKYYRPTIPEFESSPTNPVAIAEILLCPNCKKIAVPPIRICGRGHSICSGCWAMRTVCPVAGCRDGPTSARNWAIEKIFDESEFDCFYGCGKYMLGEALIGHLKICEKKPKEETSSTSSSNGIIDGQSSSSQLPIPVVATNIVHPSTLNPTLFSSLTRVTTQSMATWVACQDGGIPERAVYGGFIRMRAGGPLEKIYIIRARHGNNLCGGRLIVSEGAAYVYAPVPESVQDPRGYPDGYKFRPYRKAFYEVLTLNPFVTIRWENLPHPTVGLPSNVLRNESWIGIEPAYIARIKIELPNLGLGSNRRNRVPNPNRPSYLYLPGTYASSLGCIIGHPYKPRSHTQVQYDNVQFLVIDLPQGRATEE